MVAYRTADIEHTSHVFVQEFARHTPFFGVYSLTAYFDGLRKIIQDQKPKPYRLSAPGVDIYFAGFTSPIPRMEDGKLIFESAEPGFVVLPNDRGIGLTAKSHIQRVADEVMRDIGKRYNMIVQRNPSLLNFPKEVYGKVERFDAVLL